MAEELPKPLKVAVGTRVEVELVDRAGESERLAFELVPDRAADFAHGFLGEGTPLARAILGKTAGSVVPYQVGELVRVRLLSVAPGSATSPEELAAQRQAAHEKIVSDINRANAAAFAASYTGKWGDYDPEGVEHWDQDKP